jgi:hypothetical protein
MSAVFMVADNRIGFAPLSTANVNGLNLHEQPARPGRRRQPMAGNCLQLVHHKGQPDTQQNIGGGSASAEPPIARPYAALYAANFFTTRSSSGT